MYICLFWVREPHRPAQRDKTTKILFFSLQTGLVERTPRKGEQKSFIEAFQKTAPGARESVLPMERLQFRSAVFLDMTVVRMAI